MCPQGHTHSAQLNSLPLLLEQNGPPGRAVQGLREFSHKGRRDLMASAASAPCDTSRTTSMQPSKFTIHFIILCCSIPMLQHIDLHAVFRYKSPMCLPSFLRTAKMRQESSAARTCTTVLTMMLAVVTWTQVTAPSTPSTDRVLASSWLLLMVCNQVCLCFSFCLFHVLFPPPLLPCCKCRVF